MLTISSYREEPALITQVNRKTYLDPLEYLNVSFHLPAPYSPSPPFPPPAHLPLFLPVAYSPLSVFPSFSSLPPFPFLRYSKRGVAVVTQEARVRRGVRCMPPWASFLCILSLVITPRPHSLWVPTAAASRPTPAGKCASRNTVSFGTDGVRTAVTGVGVIHKKMV